MNWDALGALAELLGALAVVGTIGYLALQIRQTNKISRTNTVTELQRRFDELNTLLVTEPKLREVLFKADLTPDEAEQVYAFANLNINIWITVQNAFDNGQLDRDLFEGMIADVRVALARWPNIGDAVTKWLNQYPGMDHWELFNAYHEWKKQRDG